MTNQRNELATPVIFLELEDVLVTGQANVLRWLPDLYHLRISLENEHLRELWAMLAPPELRGNLRQLHAVLEPRYVIISRIASRLDKLQMMDLLHRAGLSFVADNLHTMWRTEVGKLPHRVAQIEDWFTRRRSTASAFVILDNRASAASLCASGLALHTVTCAAGEGLTAAARARALEILRWQRRAAA